MIIRGRTFPRELLENQPVDRALPVYRAYLEEKAQERKTPWSTFILPSVAGAGLGALIGHKTGNSKLLFMGATAPALAGFALKTFDDLEINRATRIKDFNDDALEFELRNHVSLLNERSPKARMWTQLEPVTIKLGAFKPHKLITTPLKVVGGIAAASLVGAYLLKKDQIKKQQLSAEQIKLNRPMTFPGGFEPVQNSTHLPVV